MRRNRALRTAVVLYRHRGLVTADALLASYPKSGNTWMKFMLTNLVASQDAEFVLDSSGQPVPKLGAHRRTSGYLPGGGRIVKSHELYRRLYGRNYGKAIYIVRDGRDVAVSYYYTLLRREGYGWNFSTFLTSFLAGKLDGYGAWHQHVRSWLHSPLSARGRLLVVRYEDLLSEPLEQLRATAEFLGIPADEQRLQEAVERNSADRMRRRWEGSDVEAAQQRKDISFVRKASVGDWADVFGSGDLDRFWSAAGDMLQTLGYPAEQARPVRSPG